MRIKQFTRPKLNKFKAYQPSPTLEQISQNIGIPVDKISKLDAGENLWVKNLADKSSLTKLNLTSYPDPNCTQLKKRLSCYTGFGPSWLACGNGSDELIDLLIRAFVDKQKEIIINPPTFPMYEFFGQLCGIKIKQVSRKTNLKINCQEIVKNISKKTKLIFIDSPGNPSGTVVSESEVKKLLKKRVLVIVDEAYFEYCGQTVLPLVKKCPNLIVLRTFSKWAGLTGLRIGYMVANPKIIKIINTIKPPYNVNQAAQFMATEVLDNQNKFLAKLKKIVKLRKKSISQLSQFTQIKVFPSKSAYIVIQTQTKNQMIKDFLYKRGVLVKTVDQPGLKNCLRISLGLEKDINRFINLLKDFYENR